MENPVLLIVALLVGGIIGYLICKKLGQNDKGDPNKSKPEGIIEIPEAINLHQNYINNLDTSTPLKETQFVWFSMKKIRDYIHYLDNIEKLNPDNPNISGVRVYFGKHNGHADYTEQRTVFFAPTIDVKLSEQYSNMQNLPFSIIPNNESSDLIGEYKIVTELLLLTDNLDTRINNANIFLNSETKNVKKNLIAKNDDLKETTLFLNDGELSPPPSK
ncbi:hypothetical protein [Kordia sp.]|uniref:hypothetical protein n=1 Tax=Kordia sp. TaxID=1965332 RepID=UPI003B5936A9